jgi:hypothetical protein
MRLAAQHSLEGRPIPRQQRPLKSRLVGELPGRGVGGM